MYMAGVRPFEPTHEHEMTETRDALRGVWPFWVSLKFSPRLSGPTP